ncbi:sialic acid-binding Ig-like lectin 5 [Salminus brasiliensis]|uniref:sialic acid-binding Ig-like lectin 5 n=1 Tax=Salminus brasiliensis TaxID=930266 RepID=UPI003B82F81D
MGLEVMGGRCGLFCFIWRVLWCVLSEAQKWSVTMPTEMSVLAGSCVDIPCTFTHPYSHLPSQIVWYSYSATGYPVVYSQNTGDVAEPFRGRTQLTGDAESRNCGLKIREVSAAMDGYQLYPWIDPNEVKHNFYHNMVKLNVRVTTPAVQLTVEGNATVGGTLRISCTVVHTCPSSPPALTFGGIIGDVQNSQADLGSGKWQAQSTISFPARTSDQGREVGCWVHHSGKQAAPSWVEINVNYAPQSVHVSGESSRAVVGGSVALECRNDANPPASSFLWYLQRSGSVNALDGGGQSITATDLLPGQNRFYCTAHSSLGVANSSSPFIISVEYQPSILPESSCVVHGRVMWCWCKVRSLPSATMKWKVEGTLPQFALSDMEEFSVLQNHTLRGKLRINKAVLHISVTCKASNAHGQKEHTLTVKAPPQNTSINLQPARVLEGQSLILACSCEAFPAVLSYSWYQVLEDSVVQLSEQSERLHLQVTGRHMGPFRCSAFNEIGEGRSASTLVHADFAPVISPNSTCTLQNGAVWCECVVESYPVATVTWTAPSVEANQTVSVEPHGPLRSTLTGHLMSGQVRLITCHATNEHGRNSLQLELKGSSAVSSPAAVVCGAVVVAILTAVAFYWIQRRRRMNNQDDLVMEIELNRSDQR